MKPPVNTLRVPTKPFCPIEPEKYITERRSVLVYKKLKHDNCNFTIDDLKNNLPKGITLLDLIFEYDGSSYDIWYEKKVKNLLYKSDLEEYNNLKIIYDKELVKYEEEMANFIALKEAEELNVLTIKIKKLNMRLEQLNKGAGKKRC